MGPVESSGNVFADLGLSNADERLAKADLAIAIESESRDANVKRITEANVFEPDGSLHLRVTYDLETGGVREPDAASWVRDVMAQELASNVPQDVRTSFAFARGGLCYGFYFSPLLTTSCHDLVRVADFASSEACRERRLHQRTLPRRVAALIGLGALPATDEPAWTAIRIARNATTHPTSRRIVGFAEAFRTLATVRGLLDRIAWLED